MAGTSSKSKGVAIGKRANISKAQSVMLGAVCGASLILGITIVGTIYFVKLISYNGKLSKNLADAADSYKSVQTNLEKVAKGVIELANDDNLESVAKSGMNRSECADFKMDNNVDISSITSGELEKFRNCSALRVVPETVPVLNSEKEKNVTAAMGSMEQLLFWAGVQFGGPNEGSANDADLPETFESLGVSVSFKDRSSKVKEALAMVESSIRNYDLQSATIKNSKNEAGEEMIEFSGTYSTYFAGKVSVETEEEVLCADPKNEKCPGDTLTKKTGGSR